MYVYVSARPFIDSDRSAVPLAVIILGRDVLLSFSAFYIRYTSLPAPVRAFCFIHKVPHQQSHSHQKTFSRYWDFSIPSAEVRPTQISKVYTYGLSSPCIC